MSLMTKSDSITFVMLSPTRDSVILSNDAISGAEVRSVRFLRFCESKNIRVQVVTNSYGEKILRGKVNADILVVRAPTPIENYSRLDVMKSFLLLPILSLRMLFKSRSKVVVGSTSLLPDAIPISIVSMFGRRAWVHFHHWIHISSLRELPRKAIQIANLSLLNASGANFLSLPSNKLYLSKIARDPRVYEFENGIDIDAAISRQKPTHDVDVLYLGRLSVKKGSRDLMEIWKRVHRLDPARSLTIAGAIEDKHFLELIEREQLDGSINVLGPVTEQRKVDLLSSAKCFVSASREEGWGMAVSEAVGYGLFVIVYNLVGYGHVLDGINRVAVGDYDSFAKLVVGGSKALKSSAHTKDWSSVLSSELELIMVDGKEP